MNVHYRNRIVHLRLTIISKIQVKVKIFKIASVFSDAIWEKVNDCDYETAKLLSEKMLL